MFPDNIWKSVGCTLGFPGSPDCKEFARNAGDVSSIPESGRSPGKGNGNPLQYSCLENPMDRRIWRATVQGFAKSWTGPSEYHFNFHFGFPGNSVLTESACHWRRHRRCRTDWLSTHMFYLQGKLSWMSLCIPQHRVWCSCTISPDVFTLSEIENITEEICYSIFFF